MKLSDKKRCGSCKIEKELQFFHKDISTKSGYTSSCKTCMVNQRRLYQRNNKKKINTYQARYRDVHFDQIKDRKLRFDYGITIDDYKKLLKKQNNACGICFREFSHENKPNVDHNHGNGKIRGILCYKCNFLLGQCSDSIDILSSAIMYINKWRTL